MRAYLVERYDPSQPVAGDAPEPVVGPDDVLVEIAAASINPLDLRLRAGDFKQLLPYKKPFVLGNDMAGTVTAVGANVQRFAAGDRVYSRPRAERIGTFAERIAVHQDDVALTPSSLEMAEAASLPLVALTAWQALVELAAVQPGQKVLVHAGSGGVGTLAIQLAKHLGATVATTTSTGNVELVTSLGADVVVDYTTQRFEDVLSQYDVVLDSLGGDNLTRSLKVLKRGGALISIAGPPTSALAEQLGLNPVIGLVMNLMSRKVRRQARQAGVRYSFLFMRASGTQLAQIAALVDGQVLRPVVDRTFPASQTLDALAYVDAGRAKAGKVVVVRD